MSFKAKKIGCGRYIQEPGAVTCLGKEVADLKGTKALIIGGKKALGAAGTQVEKSLRDAGIDYYIYTMTTDCTYETLEELSNNVVPAQKADIVVGVGGGKVMDMAKAVAKKSGLPIVNLPTSVATINCWSPMSVMYYPDRKPRDRIWHETEVDCIIVDTQILAEAPVKLFASGMADSFAKYLETNLADPAKNVHTLPYETYASKLMAKAANDIILNKGEKAYRDNIAQIISEEFEACVYANVAITAIATTINYGNRMSSKADNGIPFAHALYYAVRYYFTEEAWGFLHGEIVGLGLRAQLATYKKSEYEINSFCRFLDAIGQPKSIRDIGIEPTDKNIDILTDGCMTVWGKHPDWHRPIILEALHLIKG